MFQLQLLQSTPALEKFTLAIPGLSGFQMDKLEAGSESPALDYSCYALPSLQQAERESTLPGKQQKACGWQRPATPVNGL